MIDYIIILIIGIIIGAINGICLGYLIGIFCLSYYIGKNNKWRK